VARENGGRSRSEAARPPPVSPERGTRPAPAAREDPHRAMGGETGHRVIYERAGERFRLVASDVLLDGQPVRLVTLALAGRRPVVIGRRTGRELRDALERLEAL